MISYETRQNQIITSCGSDASGNNNHEDNQFSEGTTAVLSCRAEIPLEVDLGINMTISWNHNSVAITNSSKYEITQLSYSKSMNHHIYSGNLTVKIFESGFFNYTCIFNVLINLKIGFVMKSLNQVLPLNATGIKNV